MAHRTPGQTALPRSPTPATIPSDSNANTIAETAQPMDPALQLATALVASTTSLALVFGGLAGWFVRRLDRRFDALEQGARERNAELQRQIDSVKADTQRQFDAARDERAQLARRLDAFGERQDALTDQIADARHALGRVEGILLRTLEPDALAAPRRT